MTLPAPLRRAGMLLRQTFDLWASGATTGSSPAMWAWDAAKGGNRLKNYWPPSADFASYLNPAIVRSRARDSYRNNGWTRHGVDLLVNYVVGIGLKPQIDLRDAALRAEVIAKWNAWSEHADFYGFHSFAGLQAQAFRTCLIDGEVLALIQPGPVLKVQLLPGEFLAAQKDNAISIGGGIEYDTSGCRVGYWLYDKIPPQALNPVPHFISADRVAHLFAPLQPGYERGISALAPALTALYELQTYVEASLVRARTGSLFAGFIRSADGSPILQNQDGEPVFEPGSMCRLRSGDEIQFSQPPDPSQSHATFVETQLRAIASALNVPFELLANNVNSVSFASGRHSLLAFERICDSLVQHVAFQFCRPIFSWWLKIMIAKGELPEEILVAPVRWIAPEFQTLDSRMATNSTTQKIRSGLMSRSEAVSSTGADPEALDEEIARDNQRADKLGLVFDSDPRRVSLQGIEQPTEQTSGKTTIQ